MKKHITFTNTIGTSTILHTVIRAVVIITCIAAVIFCIGYTQEITDAALIIQESYSGLSSNILDTQRALESIEVQGKVLEMELDSIGGRIVRLSDAGEPISEALSARGSWLLGNINSKDLQSVRLIKTLIGNMVPFIETIKREGNRSSMEHIKSGNAYEEYRANITTNLGTILAKLQEVKFLNHAEDGNIRNIENSIIQFIASLDIDVSSGLPDASILDEQLIRLNQLYVTLHASENSLLIENATLKHLSISQMSSVIGNYITHGAVSGFVDKVSDMASGIQNREAIIGALQKNEAAQYYKPTNASTYTREEKIRQIINGNYNWKNSKSNEGD